MGGEYTAPVLTKGLREFIAKYARELLGNEPPPPDPEARARRSAREVAGRNSCRRGRPGFCIGCPGTPDLSRR